MSEGCQSALLLSFTAGTVSHVRNKNKFIGMYMMVVPERRKPVTSEVLGFAWLSKYTHTPQEEFKPGAFILFEQCLLKN